MKLSCLALLKMLDDEGLSLFISKNSDLIYSSKMAGITPLLDVIDRIELVSLSGSTVVDKVVGKAAALLIVYISALRVCSKLMSRAAAKVLEKHSIDFLSLETVDFIANRDGSDVCPFEKIVSRTDEPIEAYLLLKKTALSSQSPGGSPPND